ncbi:MAG: uncharacterized protein K0R58_2353 [Ramlibacter sp.]|jgi:hypothetical protein|nr:uncharacterized protein [Ramlibacter sp.]
MRFQLLSCACVVAAILYGCAAPVPTTARTLLRMEQAAPDVVLAADVRVELTTGRARPLHRGSRWRAVGVLPEGTVYQPIDAVFIIVGRNHHEAYLVLRGDALQGFYLPGEGNYSPLPAALPLPITRGESR